MQWSGWIAGLVLFCASACGGDEAKDGGSGSVGGCIPGEAHLCPGPGGCIGGQVCAADGKSYGPCECSVSGFDAGVGGLGSTGGVSGGTGGSTSSGGLSSSGGTSDSGAGGGFSNGGASATGGVASVGGTASTGGTSAGSGGVSACAGGNVMKCGDGNKDPGEICYGAPKYVSYGGATDTTLDDIAVANIDGDPRDELVVLTGTSTGGTSSGRLRIVSADAAGTFTTASQTASRGAVALGELTGDVYPDALVTSPGNALLFSPWSSSILPSDGAGGFLTGTSGPGGVSLAYVGPTGAKLVDVNADGLLDAVFTISGGISVYLATSIGVFGPGSVGIGAVTNPVTAADITGDGRPELLASSSGLTIGINDGNGAFPFWSTFLPGAVINRPQVGLVDDDGFLDVVVGTDSDGVRIFHGDGFGWISDQSVAIPVTTGNVGVAFPVDVSNDGCTDIVAFNSSAVLSILPALSKGTFDEYRSFPGLGGRVMMGDFNGDGIADFASADAKGAGVILSNP